MKRSLVLLTYNEIEATPVIFDKVPWSTAEDVFAVDGGSTDGTVEFLRSKGMRVVGQDRRGRGRAFQIAAREAKGEAVVFFSSDGNEDPADVPRLFAALEAGADMAIASRMMPGAFNEEDVHVIRLRKWVNLAFTRVVNFLWNRGPYVTDTINGYRGVLKAAFERMKIDADGFDVEFQMSIRAMKLGLKVVEFPTREGARAGGVSTAESWPTGARFVRRVWTELRLGEEF